MRTFKIVLSLLAVLTAASAAHAADASLSVFIDHLRPVFIAGEEIEVVVVFKTAGAFSGGTGKFLFAEDGAKKASAWSFKVPSMKPGRHVEIFRMDSTLLKPGTYYYYARLGDLKSNRYKITIAARERATNFGILDVPWWPEGNGAHLNSQFKAMSQANFNMVITSGTGNDAAPTFNVMGVDEPPAAEKEKWVNDLARPAFEIHPKRKRSGFAQSHDGALRYGVSTAWRPFHITDRGWGGCLAEANHGNQVGKRIMAHSWTRRRYMDWIGICFNDDPHPNFGPWPDTPAKWSHLHPWNGVTYHPPKFDGVILNTHPAPSTRYFRKWLNIPFEPKTAELFMYVDDHSWAYVNNQYVGDADLWGNAMRADATGILKKGKNLIAVKLYNGLGSGFFGGTLKVTDARGKVHLFHTDTTWKSKAETPADAAAAKDKALPPWAETTLNDSRWKNTEPFPGAGEDGRDTQKNSVVKATFRSRPDLSGMQNKRIFSSWDNCEELGKFYRVVTDQMHKMDPGMRNTTNQGLYWGPGVGEYTPIQYRALDYGISVLYTDQGEFPLSDSHDADRYQRGMREGTYMWLPLSNFSVRNNIFLRGIRVLGRKVGGLGYFCGGGGIHSGRGWSVNNGLTQDMHGRRFQMETLNLVSQRYGDMFLGLQEDDKVAWLGNFTEGAGGSFSWGTPHDFYNMHEAHNALMRAHFPGNIIEEREVLEGQLTPDRYEALFISARLVPLSPDVVYDIKEYMKKGGKVLVTDCAPAVKIPGAIKVHLSMTSGMVRHNQRWDCTKEFLRPEQAFIGYKDELLKKLRSATSPFVVAESMWITFSVQKYGKAKYVFAVNDQWPPLYTDKRKFRENQWVGNPYGSFYPGRVRMQYTMPAKHTLYFKNSDGKLPEGYVVYDMFDQKQVELKEADPSAKDWKAGKRTLDVHFVNNPARILVCLPKAIDKVSLAINPSVKRGELLRSKIRVLSADGQPIDALLPVEIKITDPDGRLRYHVWRTGGPDEEKMYKVALNDTPGKWTFWVKELVSGTISEKTFTVEDVSAAKLRVTSVKDNVILLDKYPVWEFLRKNQVEGPILIVLGPAQKRLVPLAEKLKAALEKVGNKAEVRFFDRSKTPYSYSNIAPTISVRNGEFRWCQGVIPGQGIAGIPPLVMRNVIVLATPKRAEYEWLEIATGKIRKAEFAENDAGDLWYLQGKTPNYPAPGWALIQYQWGTYVLTYDVVHVYADDDKGLERGVDKLIRISQIPEMTRGPTLRRSFDTQEGPVVGGEILAKRMTPTPNAPTTDGQKHSRERENFLIPGRMGIPIRGWAISRNSKYFAVGTDGYGENLFMFDRAGKLLWNKKVGVLNVRFLSFSRDGRKLQCSSNVEGANNTDFIVENTCVYDVKSSRRLKFLFGKQDPLGIDKKEVKKEVAAKPMGYKKEGPKLTRIVGGKEAWSFTNEKGQRVINVDISPNAKWVVLSAWSGGQPWISGSPILVLLDGKSGKKVWEKPTDGITPGHSTVKVTDGGAVILQDGSPQGQMFNILRAKDGKNVYSYLGLPGSGDQAPFEIGPGGKTILLDFGGMRPEFRLKYLDGKTPDKVIKFNEEIQSRATTPDGKHLLLGTWDGFVSLLDKKTWETVWSTETYGGPHATFTPDHKRIFVTTYVGWVYLLDAKSGDVLWKKNLNESEAVADLHAKVARWLDENTTEALKAGHTINVDRHRTRNAKGLLEMKMLYRP